MSFELKGTKAMQRKMDKIAAEFSDKVMGALRIEAELIMTKSKRDHVPIDLGPLRSSGFVGRPKRLGKDVKVKLSFGGPAAPYAAAIHEHPSQFSPPSWRGVEVKFGPGNRGPKYLEIPFKASIRGMSQRIGQRLSL